MSFILLYHEAGSLLNLCCSHEDAELQTGDTVDVDEVKMICDFVERTDIVPKEKRRVLYNILIELMSNTVQHAYCDTRRDFFGENKISSVHQLNLF